MDLETGQQVADQSVGEAPTHLFVDITHEEQRNPRLEGQFDDTGLGEETPGKFKMAFHRFVRDKMAMFALFVFFGIFIGATIYTDLEPTRWNTLTTEFNQPPSMHHWFGTTSAGLDLFAGCLKGAQQDMIIAFVVASISLVVGVLVGALSGYYGGKTDMALMRLVDLLLVIPLLAILIVLARIISGSGSGYLWVAVIIGLLGWTYIARLVRAEFLSLRERPFVEASVALGASGKRIISRHLIPNTSGTIIVNTTLTIAAALLLESTLSFLGLGIVPPQVSLGLLVNEGQDAATTQPWLFAFPAALLLIIILMVFFIGDGLQNALDPRKTKARA